MRAGAHFGGALHYATAAGQVQVVQLLLDHQVSAGVALRPPGAPAGTAAP